MIHSTHHLFKIGFVLTTIAAFTLHSFSQDNTASAATTQTPPLPALTIRGEDFVDPSGKPVKFWGVNLVATYPTHLEADAVASTLASLEINLVRPHHLLRPSRDWNPKMPSGALLIYKGNSREFDTDALDRFDYLNAALRRHGIYLSLSVNWTRRYLEDDVDILKTDDLDRENWVAALKELNSWSWKKAFDVYKMLPVLDERIARLNEEFLRNFLTHTNPYTGQTYATDTQVLTFEIVNEASTEYAIICGNKFPDYWQNKLIAKWNAYATASGVEPGDLYKPADAKVKMVRARFLRQLDQDYFARIKQVIRATGSSAPLTFSNLWRGDNYAEMNASTGDWIEDHLYMDPLIVQKPEDGFYALTRSAIAGKPYFVGELNQGEGEQKIKTQSPWRTMLPLAASAYGSLQNWSGLEWFAWTHGMENMGQNGWSTQESRTSNLGRMVQDGMMLDHLRTAGILFRRGLIATSAKPITLWVDEPFTAGDYNGLMRGKYNYKPGWQNVHKCRKNFGAAPPEQTSAEWMTQQPPNPIFSDTGEIIKDTERKQLTVAAPRAEGFSGQLDDKPAAALKYLQLHGGGFATTILVAADNQDLPVSNSLIISRTNLNAENVEIDGPSISLRGLKKAESGQHWTFTITRPRDGVSTTPITLEQDPDGNITLPSTLWHEGEIHLHR